mmetsp:Transcript_20543/g.33030  ORF Transcript_20543/g.33030 Transcript_20543/m.33030 type:complete len:244 (+) Transcript_20543:171-902(+)
MTNEAVENDDKILYLNLIIHNVSEAVKERVTKRLEKAVVIPNKMIASAAQRASELTTPRIVAQALAQTLCKKFPEKLKKKGVTVKMQEVFRENKFVVLQLRIIHVNPLSLASAWTEMGISWILDSIGTTNRKKFEDDYLPHLLTTLLAATIPKMLQSKMSNKKIEAETKVLKAQDQPIYFQKKVNQLRASQADEKWNMNPFKTFRRSSSSTCSTVSSSSSRTLRTEEESSVDSLSTGRFTLNI